MFTFTDNEILTNEKCFDNLYDLYHQRICFYKYHKIVLVLENKIMYELPLKMISVKWAVALAERSLHFFEDKIPNDNRPRLAIEAAKQWIIDPTIDSDYVAHAAHAAHAARAAAHAAVYADAVSFYQHNKQYSAAAAAAHLATASGFACFAAADPGNAAVYAADIADGVYDDQQNWSRNKLKEIVEEYLNNYRHPLKNTLKHLIIPELSDIIIKYVL